MTITETFLAMPGERMWVGSTLIQRTAELPLTQMATLTARPGVKTLDGYTLKALLVYIRSR